MGLLSVKDQMDLSIHVVPPEIFATSIHKVWKYIEAQVKMKDLDDLTCTLKEYLYTFTISTILKDFRNAPPSKMLIYCQNVIF